MAQNNALTDLSFEPDNDDYVVYPDIDRDEDVTYAYHAINDKWSNQFGRTGPGHRTEDWQGSKGCWGGRLATDLGLQAAIIM